MTGSTARGASPRRRLTHDQTRALLLEYGSRVLHREGLTFGMELVSLEEAVRETGVSRTSAYRIWSDDPLRSPQESFKRDVLIESLSIPTDQDFAALNDMRKQLVQALHEVGERSWPTAAEAANAVAEALMDYVMSNRSRLLHRSTQAIMATQPQTRWDLEIRETLDSTERLWRGAMISHVLEPMLDSLKLRARFDTSREAALEQASVAISAFISGLIPKLLLPNAGSVIEKPIEDSSDLRLGTICLASLISTFFEPDV